MHDFGSMYFKQLIQPDIHHHIRFLIETPKYTSFPGNVNSNASVDGKGEQDNKPDWAIEDGDAKYIPVHGDPAPQLRKSVHDW
jgi:hypothetical protein